MLGADATSALEATMEGMVYTHLDIVKQQVVELVTQTNDLQPAKESFKISGGTKRLHLLSLQGHLRLNFGEHKPQMLVPLKIALKKHYPKEGPVCFLISPPGRSLVASHPLLDDKGRITIEYVKKWDATNDLVGLLFALQDEFTQLPPLTHATPAPHLSADMVIGKSDPVLHPPPLRQAVSMTTSTPTISVVEDGENVCWPRGLSFENDLGHDDHFAVSPNASPSRMRNQSPTFFATPSSSPRSHSPAPSPPSTSPAQSREPSPRNTANTTTSSHDDNNDDNQSGAQVGGDDGVVGLIQQKTMLWLEKLRKEHALAMHKQHRIFAALKSNAMLMDRQFVHLSQQKADLLANLHTLECPTKQVTAWLARMNDLESGPPDNLVTPADTRSNQLLQLVAEDRTLEDSQYYMDRGLELGVIDMDIWIRTTRQLTKEQYKTRALILKILSS